MLTAARARVRWLFAEFASVMVTFSGGKDSTAVLHLAREAAEAAGRLPLDVLFVDQEAEWGGVVEYMRRVREDARFRLHWVQFPVWVHNAGAGDEAEGLMNAWAPGVEWMREREPGSVQANDLGTEAKREIFDEFFLRHVPGAADGAIVCGVRAVEAPRRQVLLSQQWHKWATWGWTKRARVACPIYDWSDGDVWRWIHDTGEPYCRVYDAMYRRGVPLQQMRISSFSHAAALPSLALLQEIEPDTWARFVERVRGVAGAAQLRDLHDTARSWYTPRQLPDAFGSWVEYRAYLLEHLVGEADRVEGYRQMFMAGDRKHAVGAVRDAWLKVCCRAIIWNDWRGRLLVNFSLQQRFAATTGGVNTRVRRVRPRRR